MTKRATRIDPHRPDTTACDATGSDTTVGTLPGLIRRSASLYGDREAIVEGKRRLGFSELERESAGLARGLLALGCGKGTRVGILFPNGPDWVIALLAATRIGAIAVPINTFSRTRELVWLLRHSDVQVLLACDAYRGHDYLDRLEEGVDGLASCTEPVLALAQLPLLRHILVWGEARRPWARSGPIELERLRATPAGASEALLEAVEAQVTASDPALVIYTSGSTADPKGVVHAQGTLVRQASVVAEHRELRPAERLYLNMPFFWVGGLLLGPLCCLHAGVCLHCDTPLDEEGLFQLFEREQITRLSSAFPSSAVLRAHPRFDPGRHGQVRELVDGGTTRVFGMTESFGWHSAELPGADPPGPPGSLGRALPGIERRIVDPDTGVELGPGESGELVLRGPNLMLGYHRRSREEAFESDGAFRTGDRCRIDADGNLFFEGRLDEVIRSRGTNVAPAEVEAVLQSMPGVKRAAVLGLPDAGRGERVVAVVVPATAAAPSPASIREHLRGQLAAYKLPAEIVVLAESELPLGPTQKVLKPRLKEMLAARR